RKLVIDLSTQRSIARASFHTSTPTSRSAWRMPRRKVTASKLPPDMVRTTTASGRRSLKPSRRKPEALAVAKPHAGRRIETHNAPRPVSALESSRACQSKRSTTRPMDGRAPANSATTLSGERGIEQTRIDASGMKAFAGVERRHDHLGRAEQHRIDRVEIAARALEDFHERPPVVARFFARQLLGQQLRLARGAGNKEMDPAGIDDRVVGAPHGGHEVRMRRRERRRAQPLDDAVEREFQFM